MEAIDMKEAVQRAKDFATTIFEPEKISKLGLEAIERSEDGRYWLVTLGFTRPHLYSPPPKMRPLLQIEGIAPRREYKVFPIDAHSGEAIGVRILRSDRQ